MKDIRYIFILFIIYLFFAAPLIGRPLVTDEVAMAQAAKVKWSFADLGPGNHPPLYIDILRSFSQFFGLQDNRLRLAGILCFLLNLFLIYHLALELFKDRYVGFLASLIFALHPMAIQGSMILDIDNTILTVISTATFYYCLKSFPTRHLKEGIFLSLLFFLGLWAKLSTPFLLMGSLCLFFFLRKDKIAASQIFTAALGAVFIFILFWKIDSLVFNFPFSSVFRRLTSVGFRGVSGVSVPGSQELLLRILRVSLWLGTPMMFFWLVIVIRRIKAIILDREGLNYADLLIIYSVGIFAGYTLMGGLSFGFAKYQYPLLPVLSVLLASAIKDADLRKEKKYFIVYLAVSLSLVLINILNLPEPLYQINYLFRKIAIFWPQKIKAFSSLFILKLSLGLISLILGAEITRRVIRGKSFLRCFYFVSLAFIILTNFFTDIYLRGAPYFTTYCYGRDVAQFRDISGLCRRIIQKYGQAKIIAPDDVLYDSGSDVFIGYDELWNNRDRFIKTVEKENVPAVIYGFTYNAIFSYRHIFFDPLVSAMLKDNFTQIHRGEYTVWIRR